MNSESLSEILIERILARILVDDNCWNWLGATTKIGYPLIHVPGTKSSAVYPHRVLCQVFHGACPLNMQVRHLCRSKVCLRPSHLCWDTQSANVQDQYTFGEREIVSVDAAKVLRLHKLCFSQRQIAACLGVSQTLIYKTLKRELKK